MFLFDLAVYTLSTLYWYADFSLPKNIEFLAAGLVIIFGIFTLYLKSQYKIREFNITFKNVYLLFEGIVMTHVLPAVYLLLFAASIKSLSFDT